MYRRLIAVLIGVAVLYPIWWLFTPVGIGWVGAPTALLVFAFLDLLSKAGYGLLLVTQVRKLPESTRGE
jgi:bacteriorhodopsin